MDLSWFSCEESSFLLSICDLCRALFSPRVPGDSTKTAAIATIGRCSALRYDSETRKLDPPKRSLELTTRRIPLLVARSFLCSSLDFRVHRIFTLLKRFRIVSSLSSFRMKGQSYFCAHVLTQDFYTDYVPA